MARKKPKAGAPLLGAGGRPDKSRFFADGLPPWTAEDYACDALDLDRSRPLVYRLTGYFYALERRHELKGDLLARVRALEPELARLLTEVGGSIDAATLRYTVGPDGRLRCGLPGGTGTGGQGT